MKKKEIYGVKFPFKTPSHAERLSEVMNQAIQDLHDEGNDRIKVIVESEDGVCEYGMEICHVLDNDYLAVGMMGNGQGKIFDVSSESEDAVDWILEDIEIAVGDEPSVTLEYEKIL